MFSILNEFERVYANFVDEVVGDLLFLFSFLNLLVVVCIKKGFETLDSVMFFIWFFLYCDIVVNVYFSLMKFVFYYL